MTTRTTAVIAFVVFVGASVGFTQDAMPTVAGSVRDQRGGLVPNLPVILTKTDSGDERSVQTDETGRYDFGAVAPGEYELSVLFGGFRTYESAVSVADAPVYLHPILRIGRISETVVVIGGNARAPRRPRVEAPRSAAPVAQPCDMEAVARGIGGFIDPPTKTRHVNPFYTADAQRARLAGRVVLEAAVATDGRVGNIRVAEAPHETLGAIVAQAVSQWLFTPTLLDCEPVVVELEVVVDFYI